MTPIKIHSFTKNELASVKKGKEKKRSSSGAITIGAAYKAAEREIVADGGVYKVSKQVLSANDSMTYSSAIYGSLIQVFVEDEDLETACRLYLKLSSHLESKDGKTELDEAILRKCCIELLTLLARRKSLAEADGEEPSSWMDRLVDDYLSFISIPQKNNKLLFDPIIAYYLDRKNLSRLEEIVEKMLEVEQTTLHAERVIELCHKEGKVSLVVKVLYSALISEQIPSAGLLERVLDVLIEEGERTGDTSLLAGVCQVWKEGKHVLSEKSLSKLIQFFVARNSIENVEVLSTLLLGRGDSVTTSSALHWEHIADRLLLFLLSRRRYELTLQFQNFLHKRDLKPLPATRKAILVHLAKVNKMAALEMFHQLQKEGHPLGADVYNAAINIYGRMGKIRKVEALVKEMEDKGVVPGRGVLNKLNEKYCQREQVELAKKMSSKIFRIYGHDDEAHSNLCVMYLGMFDINSLVEELSVMRDRNVNLTLFAQQHLSSLCKQPVDTESAQRILSNIATGGRFEFASVLGLFKPTTGTLPEKKIESDLV